jgi:hypothetical protein
VKHPFDAFLEVPFGTLMEMAMAATNQAAKHN